MLLLSELVGSEVRSADGDLVGRLVDLTVEAGEHHPEVRRLAVGRRRQVHLFVEWKSVSSFERDGIELTLGHRDIDTDHSPLDLRERELCLARDVLDTQIVDIAGKRVARASEVLLARSPDDLRVVAVDVSAAGVWRRVGLKRIAARVREQAVDWADLHLTSTRGHALALANPGAQVHRLGSAELAALVALLPTARAAEVLEAVSPAAAASALSATHPRVGTRLLQAVPGRTASSVLTLMPSDDASEVLRGLAPETLEALLDDVVSERAAMLRRILAHPADTAGGLMNTEARTALVGEAVETIRERLAADMPELEGLATVFVVDEVGRPVGAFEPNDLLANRTEPRVVPAVPATLPAERVIDLFALHDYLALPVVDGEGRLVGVVTIDDVLEDLVAERLPGLSPYARVRRRAQKSRLAKRHHESHTGS